MSSSSIVLPRYVEVGSGACRRLPELLARIGCRRPLLVTDSTMLAIGHASMVSKLLTDADIPCEIYSDTIPEPTAASLQSGVQQLVEGKHDGIVALGGGSPIDSAKAMAVLAVSGGTMRDYMVPALTDEGALPIVAIPTTAGTGSEATRFTIVTDESCDEKMLCVGLAFLPMAAIIDADLTVSLPPRTTADTGLDALTHAIEACVSAKANEFSDAQALAAMRLIGPNLRKAYRDGNDLAAREAMMLGAHLAGIAFSNSSVALIHGMSRPIGAHFHVPHGLSNAMLLPLVTAWSLPVATARYAACARALGVSSNSDDETAGKALVDELRTLNRDLEVPSATAAGVGRERLLELAPTMADQALASGSPANNPRIPHRDEIVSLYHELLTVENI